MAVCFYAVFGCGEKLLAKIELVLFDKEHYRASAVKEHSLFLAALDTTRAVEIRYLADEQSADLYLRDKPEVVGIYHRVFTAILAMVSTESTG